jgi:hypothetical protein
MLNFKYLKIASSLLKYGRFIPPADISFPPRVEDRGVDRKAAVTDGVECVTRESSSERIEG